MISVLCEAFLIKCVGELDGSAREISISFTEELVDLSSDDTKHMKLSTYFFVRNEFTSLLTIVFPVESYIKITPMPAGNFPHLPLYF